LPPATVFPPRRAGTSVRTAAPAGVKDIPRLEEVPMSDFPPVAYVVITVSDLSRSVPWYQRLIGSDPVLDEDTGPFRHVVFALGDVLLSLHGFHEGTPSGDRFEERRIGLDHLAFGCANRDELVKWGTRLDELGIQHGSIVDANYGSGLSFRDPDNIALEFFAPPAA
jgi:glyoxylase I family protein